MVRLQGDVETYTSNVQMFLVTFSRAAGDRVLTDEEWIECTELAARIDLVHAVELTSLCGQVADSHNLAQIVLNAGAVTPWVERRTHEKGEAFRYLECLPGELPPSNITSIRQRDNSPQQLA